jgi:hypothetical protein
MKNDFNADMNILERGTKAVEGFYPVSYEDVDKALRDATKRTGDSLKIEIKEMLERLETKYA